MLTDVPVIATIPAEDVARGRKFYTETLGMKVVMEPAETAVVMEAGAGTRIFLYQRLVDCRKNPHD